MDDLELRFLADGSVLLRQGGREQLVPAGADLVAAVDAFLAEAIK